MKIIKQGILPENRSYVRRCENCGCAFQFFGRELTQVRYSEKNLPGVEHVRRWIRCPFCNKEIAIQKHE